MNQGTTPWTLLQRPTITVKEYAEHWPQLPLWVLYQRRRASRGLEYPQGHDDHSEKGEPSIAFYAALFVPYLRLTEASARESLVYVQKQLGHASIQITEDTYGNGYQWAIRRRWIAWTQ